MTRKAWRKSYRRVRRWIREHGRCPSEREVNRRDWMAFEALYARARASLPS